MELQGRVEDIRRQGLGLIAISYDAPETLRAFASSRRITFPLISDHGSAIIRRYGLLNQTIEPANRAYGVPHPGTFIVDRRGVVSSRFFEDAYQERNTAGSILVKAGLDGAAQVSARTAHLALSASISDTTVAPGERVTIALDITPARGMHVYAPGAHSYQVVRLVFDPQPWLRAHATAYAPSEVYLFEPLNERVEVYAKRFRLTTDVTILATPDVQKLLSTRDSIAITGALEYQACDDKVCFNPSRVPVSFELKLKPLDRNPSGRSR